MPMPITFHTADIKFSLRNRIALRKFITEQVTKSSSYQSINLSFIFCSDEYLLNINRQFLNHDYYTDIITFPLSESKEHIEAEIYISIDRVRENELKFKAKQPSNSLKGGPLRKPTLFRGPEGSVDEELHRVMFHGVLHLLGYKDKTKANKLEMRKMEDVWINRFKKASAKK